MPLAKRETGGGLRAGRRRRVPDGFLIGLLVGEGRLVRHGRGEGGVFADRVVHPEAGADDGALDFGHAPGQAHARRKGLVPREDQRSGQTVLARILLGLAGEPASGLVAISARRPYFSV